MGNWQQRDEDGWSAEVYEPDTSRPGLALLFLHGHSHKTLSHSDAWTRALEHAGLRAVCPLSSSGWWVEGDERIGLDTPLEFLQQRVAPSIRRWWDVPEPGIALTGVSLGGQGALKLAYRHAREFPVVAAIAPAIDFHRLFGLGLPLDGFFDDAESARQQTVPLHLNPLSWPRHQLLLCDADDEDWYESVQRLASKLSSSGVLFDQDFTARGLGHCWEYFDSVADDVVEFITSRLEQVLAD